MASSSHTSGPPESPWVGDTRLSTLGLGSALDQVEEGAKAKPAQGLTWQASVPPSRKPAQSMPGVKEDPCTSGAEQRSEEMSGTCASCRKLEYSPAPANQERVPHTQCDSACRPLIGLYSSKLVKKRVALNTIL